MAKKSGTAIRDFFISLGFDASDVEKGFKQIEKEFSKLQKTLNGTMTANVKVQQQQNKAQKESVKQSKAKVTSEKQLYAIEKARAELKRKIAYIEKQEKALGTYVPGHYKDQKNAARSKNIDRIKIESDKLNETYRTYANLEKTLAKQERDRATAADRANKAQIRADKARIKEQQRLEKQSLDSLNRQRQFAYRDNLRALNRQRRLAIRQQMIEDKRWVVNDRVNLISRRADWMIQRQGGQAKGLSKTQEHKDYTYGLENIRKMASTARTESDFKRLDRAIASLNLSYNQLIVKNKELQREFKVSSFTAKALQDSLRNLARSYVSVFAVIGGVGASANMGINLENAGVGLITGTGSLEAANKELGFLKEQSRLYGFRLSESVKAYGKIMAGAKTAGLSIAETRDLFDGLNQASIGFSLTSDEMTGVFKAITDSFSKGTLMAEELKGQLGDRMPVAVGAMAKALNVTTPELFKMMEAGELIAADVLPKLSKGLKAMAVDSGGLEAGLNSVNTAMNRFGVSYQSGIGEAFEAGLSPGLKKFFDSLTDATEQSAPLFKSLGKIVGVLAATLGTLLLAGKQLVRPFYSFFDAIVGGSKDASKEVGILTKLFAALGYAILTPFVWLERMNNQLEKTSTLSKAVAAGIGIMVTVVSSRISLMLLSMVGLNARLASFVSGWGMLSKVFGLLSRHPFIRMLLAIFTAAEAIDSVTESETYAKEKQRLVNDYSKDGELAWYDKLTASAMAFQYSAHTEVAGGIRSIIDWFKAEKVEPKQIINNIYSNSSDPEEVARAVVRQQQQAEYQTNMR